MPLHIAPGVMIPDEEIEAVASRSSGPGGQHVNKTASRIALKFDVLGSPSLPEAVRERLRAKLGHRIAVDGTVRVVAQDARSQHANRKAAMDRLEALLARALTVEAPRVKTRISRAERARRLEAKRIRSQIKRGRGAGRPDGNDS
jgi:ribosome-associated protein